MLIPIFLHFSMDLSNAVLLKLIIDAGTQVDTIYIDFSKALDRLDHYKLPVKLSSCGYESVEINVTSGVLEGSVLGPLFFNLFVNDITDNLTSPALLNADDMKLFRKITRREDQLKLQADLMLVCDKKKLLLEILE
ncbi:uncharacterized protein LOC135138637 [Zophobas morio]|uniref:uncharacterized protein LOC135138637 n=1 Tax=Zophobas morio TaxID=2755281 RepID=UPI003082CBDA